MSVERPDIDLVMVSEGMFRMGDDTVLLGGIPHDVFLSGYMIGKFPVTRGQYQQFIDAGGYASPEFWSERGDKWRRLKISRCQPKCWDEMVQFGDGSRAFQTERHPAVTVSYYEAEAFSRWFGGRLPTEAEWEKAAGWNPEQEVMRKYPWGNEWDAQLCNCSENSNYPLWTSPVDAFPGSRSYYGCLDMLGNCAEWCLDRYGPDYFKQPPKRGWRDPKGPTKKGVWGMVIKGGEWRKPHALTAIGVRQDLFPDFGKSGIDYLQNTVGFRVAVPMGASAPEDDCGR